MVGAYRCGLGMSRRRVPGIPKSRAKWFGIEPLSARAREPLSEVRIHVECAWPVSSKCLRPNRQNAGVGADGETQSGRVDVQVQRVRTRGIQIPRRNRLGKNRQAGAGSKWAVPGESRK